MATTKVKKISESEARYIVQTAIQYAHSKGFGYIGIIDFYNVMKIGFGTSVYDYRLNVMFTYKPFCAAFYGEYTVGSKCGKKWPMVNIFLEKQRLYKEEKVIGEKTWDWLDFENVYCTHKNGFVPMEEACHKVYNYLYHQEKCLRLNDNNLLDYVRKHIPNYVYNEPNSLIIEEIDFFASGGSLVGGAGGRGSTGIVGGIQAGAVVSVNSNTGQVSALETPNYRVLDQEQLQAAISVLRSSEASEYTPMF